MANPNFDPDQMHFFYKNKYLGSCEPGDAWCPKLLELMESDPAVASMILDYMNSLGDPVFPVSEEDWGTPETDISKVDIKDLYNTFLQELDYEYRDFPDDFYVGGDYLLPDFEIFVGEVADDVQACGDIKASTMPKPTVDSVLKLIADKKIIFKNNVAYLSRGKKVLPKEYRDCIYQTKYAHWINEWSCEQAEKFGDRAYYDYDGEVEVDSCDKVTASTNHSDIVNKIYSVMMNYEYGYDPDMTDINAMLQELTGKGVHVDTSDAFKKAWISAHNKAERKTWGSSGDSYHYDSLTPEELEAIENYDTEYWEYVKDHPFNLKPASITSSTDTKYLATMVNASSYDSADNPMTQEVVNLLQVTDNIIADFTANNEFDPYDALSENEDMSQQLYSASVNFQADIKNAIDKFRESTTWSARLF